MLMTNKKVNKHDDDIEFLKYEFSDLKVNIQRDLLSEMQLRDIKYEELKTEITVLKEEKKKDPLNSRDTSTIA